ncbi:MAG: hypothetical protein WBV94_12645 [Blastocatellia bacterium]
MNGPEHVARRRIALFLLQNIFKFDLLDPFSDILLLEYEVENWTYDRVWLKSRNYSLDDFIENIIRAGFCILQRLIISGHFVAGIIGIFFCFKQINQLAYCRQRRDLAADPLQIRG